MQWYEILIITSAVAFVVFVVVKSAIIRKKGKGCCDCSSCGLNCARRKSDNENQNN